MHTVAHELYSVGVILVAAGRGERLGASVPKAFVELGDLPLVQRCVRTVTSLPHGGQLVIVVPEGYAAQTLEIAEAESSQRWQIAVVAGGRSRNESVRHGLDALHDTITTVLVHDAARPLTPPQVFERVLAQVHRHGTGVVPVIAVADTLKRVSDDGIVLATEQRHTLRRAQTPQGFGREQLEAAHRAAELLAESTPTDDASTDDAPTDDAEIVQRFGGQVRWTEGSPLAHKVTVPEDLQLLDSWLKASR